MKPVSSTPERPEVVPPSMGKVSPALPGVPSQDPREEAHAVAMRWRANRAAD